MRCFLKRSLIIAFPLAVFLLLTLNLALWTHEDPEMKELMQRAQMMGLQDLHSDLNGQRFQRLVNATSFLNFSHRHLLGFPPRRKKVLTVGLCSVKRKRANYLLKTLNSIFKQSTEDELKKMIVVVHLADADRKWNSQMADSIARNFTPQLLLGRLMVTQAPSEFYPPLKGLKRNYNDAEDRVRFRSKQNVDYAYLMNFSANFSTYFIMIEDDVICSKSFFTAIMIAVASQKGFWVTLEFSQLGYIGKLYHSSDLPTLSQFLLLFYQEMPCDWLLVHFRRLLTQNGVIRIKPSLFQHIGHFSSFQGTSNQLQDYDFLEDPFLLPDNPPADFITNMDTYEKYQPQNAYSNTMGYFWSKAPTVGKSFTLVFKQAVRISRIQIHTGSPQHPEDYLQEGLVELGTQKNSSGKGCATYTTIGIFERGHFDRQDLENSTASAPECVSILVTMKQKEWLIISSIRIWTKHGSWSQKGSDRSIS